MLQIQQARPNLLPLQVHVHRPVTSLPETRNRPNLANGVLNPSAQGRHGPKKADFVQSGADSTLGITFTSTDRGFCLSSNAREWCHEWSTYPNGVPNTWRRCMSLGGRAPNFHFVARKDPPTRRHEEIDTPVRDHGQSAALGLPVPESTHRARKAPAQPLNAKFPRSWVRAPGRHDRPSLTKILFARPRLQPNRGGHRRQQVSINNGVPSANQRQPVCRRICKKLIT